MFAAAFVFWFKSNIANEEKEMKQLENLQPSPRNDVMEGTCRVLVDQKPASTSPRNDVTDSRSSSGLSPQSLAQLSATSSPGLKRQSRKSDVFKQDVFKQDVFKHDVSNGTKMSEMTARQEIKAVVHM
jgi:hypothetical protein